jgi:hypothetical protein
MTTLDKAWALNQLRHKRNSYIAAIAAMHLLNVEKTVSVLRSTVVMFKGDIIYFNPKLSDRVGRRYELKLRHIVDEYRWKRESHMVTLEEFHKFVNRNLIKECYEVVEDYAEYARITITLRAQPWFHFARIVRNVVTHNLHFAFSKYDMKILPVSWNGKTIEASMNGQDMPANFANPHITLDLIEAMKEFVAKN